MRFVFRCWATGTVASPTDEGNAFKPSNMANDKLEWAGRDPAACLAVWRLRYSLVLSGYLAHRIIVTPSATLIQCCGAHLFSLSYDREWMSTRCTVQICAAAVVGEREFELTSAVFGGELPYTTTTLL